MLSSPFISRKLHLLPRWFSSNKKSFTIANLVLSFKGDVRVVPWKELCTLPWIRVPHTLQVVQLLTKIDDSFCIISTWLKSGIFIPPFYKCLGMQTAIFLTLVKVKSFGIVINGYSIVTELVAGYNLILFFKYILI